jgi:transcriptional regulator with XRE-family HTH domain
MEKTAVSPDEVMNALRQYLENTGESRRAAAVKMGVNRHTLCRWLSDKQSPQKENLVMVATFLRRSGYL